MSALRGLSALMIALHLAHAAPAEAQAWTRDQGHAYAQLGYRTIGARSVYGADGEARPIASLYRQHALSFYGEVGLIDRFLMASIDGDLVRAATVADVRTVGFGDLRLGLFTGIVERPFRLTFGLSLGIPTGDTSPPNRRDSATPGAILPTGDGEWDVAARLLVGHGFGHRRERYPFTHFVSCEVGYWVRSRGFVDQMIGRVEFGARPKAHGWNRLLLLVRVSAIVALDSGAPNAGLVGLGDGVSYVSIGPEVAMRLFDGVHLVGGVDGAFHGESVPAAPQYKLAIAYSN